MTARISLVPKKRAVVDRAYRIGSQDQSHLRKESGAIREVFEVVRRDAGAVKDRDQQIRMRRVLWIVQVLSSLDAATTSNEYLRKRIGVVSIAVRHVASEQ